MKVSMECPMCLGSKEEWIPDDLNASDSMSGKVITCRVCDGEGTIPGVPSYSKEDFIEEDTEESDIDDGDEDIRI